MFASAERVEFSGKVTDLLNSQSALHMEIEEIISFYDFKNRRTVVFGTNFGNIAVVEENSSLGYIYTVFYDRDSPLKDMLPFRDLCERDMSYIFGNEEEGLPNISVRVDLMISAIREYFD
jgi:hypothetical protein